VIATVIHLVMGAHAPPLGSWLSPVLGVLLWPWLFVLLDLLRLRARERERERG